MVLIHNVTSHFHRDIFYTNSQLFGNQASVDNIIDDISCMLKVPRRSLHVVSHSKYKILMQSKTVVALSSRAEAEAGSETLSGGKVHSVLFSCHLIVYFLNTALTGFQYVPLDLFRYFHFPNALTCLPLAPPTQILI